MINKQDMDNIMRDVSEYVLGTFSEHYVMDGQIQAVDIWNANGSLATTARDTAIKYLIRYGKKDGKNKKDLLKAIHYIALMIYADHYKKQNSPVATLPCSPPSLTTPFYLGDCYYDYLMSDMQLPTHLPASNTQLLQE